MTIKQVAPVLFASELDDVKLRDLRNGSQAHRETDLNGAHLI
jgi:hypothetical protein